MSNAEKYRNRLITLLKELFQLDQPELDFGLYKIMHAKSVQITRFLENDLLKEIQQAFGDRELIEAAQLKAQAVEKLKYALGDAALDENGKLNEAYATTPAVKNYVAEIAAAEAAKDTLNAEAEVYDHLYRFFERYYDNGDFMSRRYYARESDSRAAPYAVPYDGREVYLHWANKDQYYIKSSEYLSNYTFELNEAIRQEADRQKTLKGKIQALDLGDVVSDKLLKVHFRIVDATEGEHGNIKTASDQKRFFIIHDELPCYIENGELVIQFQYRTDNEKSGQDNKWQETRLQQAAETILQALKADKQAEHFLRGLSLLAPTDAKDKRTLLVKHLQKYANKNSMDYFIHKDLGGFLRRELDFYIKNEIMRLDDLEAADAPQVEQYLGKVKVLRRIAQQLIAFLAQLEDFQKKLWLKKKFVTETNYCITLDRIPKQFYAEIAANDRQREEWVNLFAIDEIKKDLASPVGYSKPLKVEFLQANPFLLVDTALFEEGFRHRLLSEIPALDAQCDGVLIHSENFQALNVLNGKYEQKISCVYADPPYNAKSSEILYKNSYKHSSWLSMMSDRLNLAVKLKSNNGSLITAIDENEASNLSQLLRNTFPVMQNDQISIVHNPAGVQGDNFSYSHEYAIYTYEKQKKLIGKTNREEESEEAFRDWGGTSSRSLAKNCFYPIIVKDNHIIGFGDVCPVDFHPEAENVFVDDKVYIYPIADDGEERKWVFARDSVEAIVDQLSVREKNGRFSITRTKSITSYKTVWSGNKYYANIYGSKLLNNIFSDKRFDFPKSVFTVQECLYAVESFRDKDSISLDYFAGSGTSGHAVILCNRADAGRRKYILLEMGAHFENVVRPRIKKVIYSNDWKDGKPVSREGISHCFKYLRLESYEDALNNLTLWNDAARDAVLEKNPAMQRDYLLNYFLDVETQDSQSLLNIADFRDPTSYKMWIKKPGSEEQALQTIDLIETFNWLIGLWVEHMAAPQSFNAECECEKDVDLPKDQNTRLICKKLKPANDGEYWFRLIEGYTLKVPGDNSSKIKTLIVWRKQTDDAEKDNAVLQKYLMEKLQISPRENTYGVIYVNGSHTLPNPVVEGEQTKVRLIEEAFRNAMWAGE